MKKHFSEWIMTQTERKGSIGELAASIKNDEFFPKHATYKQCERYLLLHGADNKTMEALFTAWKKYLLLWFENTLSKDYIAPGYMER
jgi:uncharacterized protein YozE (UPF0346 family)